MNTMSTFKGLREISGAFNVYLSDIRSDLYCPQVGDVIEEDIAKKMLDISFFTAKSRLLQAKNTALTPEITKQDKDKEKLLSSYEETATQKVIETQAVAMFTQTHAVQKLLITPNSELHPEQMERKKKIITELTKYRNKETQLRHLDALLTEKESDRDTYVAKWDTELGEFRDWSAMPNAVDNEIPTGPTYDKICNLVNKMEIMRWMISRLVTARTGAYDWMADPDRKFICLKLTREPNIIENFIEA